MGLHGNINIFAIEVLDSEEDQLKPVNIYVNGISLCQDDNIAYVPQFLEALKSNLEYYRRKSDYLKYQDFFKNLNAFEAHKALIESQDEYSDIINESCTFLNWGPTTDNFHAFILPVFGGDLNITLSFVKEGSLNQGDVFGVKVYPFQIIEVLSNTIKELEAVGNSVLPLMET